MPPPRRKGAKSAIAADLPRRTNAYKHEARGRHGRRAWIEDDSIERVARVDRGLRISIFGARRELTGNAPLSGLA